MAIRCVELGTANDEVVRPGSDQITDVLGSHSTIDLDPNPWSGEGPHVADGIA